MDPNGMVDRLEKSGPFPPAWEPVEDEIVVGLVETYTEGSTPYGPCYVCILQVEERRREGTFDPEPRLAVWLGKTVLKNEFQRQRPQVGDRVGIRYLGKHPKGYRNFSMMVEHLGRVRPVGALAAPEDIDPCA